MNLGNKPVEISIEDVYLLVVPSPQNNVDPEEEEERAQAAKQERLENAEFLHLRDQNVTSGLFEYLLFSPYVTLNIVDYIDEAPQGFWASLTAKIVNNIQITVRNIHIRYEDKMSVPGVSSFIDGVCWTQILKYTTLASVCYGCHFS